MVNRIFIGILFILLCVGGWLAWKKYKTGSTSESGAVIDTTTGQEARPMPSRSDAPGTINTERADTGSGSTANLDGNAHQSSMIPAAPQPAAPPAVATQDGLGALPVGDSQSENNPNGLHFAGSGRYQWYRQGNLTWRIDTVSGSSCIDYATMDEWSKPNVYMHGCGGA